MPAQSVLIPRGGNVASGAGPFREATALLYWMGLRPVILFPFVMAIVGGAFAAPTTGDDAPSRPAHGTIVGADDANVMRVLQRDKRARKTT